VSLDVHELAHVFCSDAVENIVQVFDEGLREQFEKAVEDK